MEAGAGLLLMLLGVCSGVETSCDGRQNGAQCYGALGGTVDIQLMDNASEIFKFQWKKDRNTLLSLNNMIIANKLENRSLFTPNNGTFRINNLSRTDSGQYELEIFNSNGKKTGHRTLQLFVQAPVSSVQLVSQCLSQGQMKVSCSSEGGDSPQYSWTLDGHTLTDSELLSGTNETNVIVLRQIVPGRLICSVWNNISNFSNNTKISTCGFIFINCTSNGTLMSVWVFKENKTLCVKPATTVTVSDSVEQNIFPVLIGVLAVLVLFLVISTAVVCAKRKKKTNRVEEDDQELTYSDIRVVKKQEKQVEQKGEEEVEYGQVKVSKRPDQFDAVADDSLYAKVLKD